MAESKAGKLLYRGLYGTSSSISSWNAPLKPKASSALGVFLWGKGKKRRVFAWGIRSLPIALDVATLVSRGPTALGAVLTNSPELASERATELVAQPVQRDGGLFLVGVGRAQSGRVLGAFVVHMDTEFRVVTRLPRVQVPAGCEVIDFVVGESVCVLVMLKVKGGGMGMFRGLFGGGCEKPVVDEGFGTVVTIVPRDGSEARTSRVEGEIVTNVVRVEEGDGVISLSVVVLRRKGGKERLELSTVRDIQCGRMMETDLRRGSCKTCWASLSIGANTAGHELSEEASNLRLLDVGSLGEDLSFLSICNSLTSANKQDSKTVCTVYNHSIQRSGIVVTRVDGAEAGTILVCWMAEGGYNVGRPLMNYDEKHFCVLVSPTDPTSGMSTRLLIFNINSVEEGPIHSVKLDMKDFGTLGCSVGGEWVREAVDWTEEGNKPVKSAYEIFDSRRWNDIDSSFSSLGLGQ